jgi:hypothetical protein
MEFTVGKPENRGPLSSDECTQNSLSKMSLIDLSKDGHILKRSRQARAADGAMDQHGEAC